MSEQNTLAKALTAALNIGVDCDPTQRAHEIEFVAFHTETALIPG